jgi:6-phosphofructokinase
MGVKAAKLLLAGETDVMIGLSGRDIISVPLDEVATKNREPNLNLLNMAETLAK